MAGISNTTIYNKLIDIEGRLSTVEAFAPVVSELQRIVVAGNGTPPMKERMNNVEKYIEGCKGAEKEVKADKKDDKKWLKRTAWGALITGVISSIIGIAILFIKLLPILEAIK